MTTPDERFQEFINQCVHAADDEQGRRESMERQTANVRRGGIDIKPSTTHWRCETIWRGELR